MRARNLKPGFFKNEYLAELGPCGQLLFEGLWCMADRDGKLEDRPKRIQAEIFPYYQPEPDIETLLNSLHQCSEHFIIRYEVNGKRYIKIPHFSEHQRPHSNEKPSIIPDPINIELSTKVNSTFHQGEQHFVPNAEALRPDSLNPDVLNPEKSTPPISPPAVPQGDSLGGSPSGSPRGDFIFSPGLKNDELAEAESSTGNHDPANKTREKYPEFSEIAESAAPAVINSDVSPFQNNPEAEPAKSSPAAFAAVGGHEVTETSNFAAAAAESAGNVLAGAAAAPEPSPAPDSPEEKTRKENVVPFPQSQSRPFPEIEAASNCGDGDDSAAGSSGGPEPPENVQSGPRSGGKKKAKPKAAPVPYQEIADAWNENAPENLPRVANLNDKRRRMLKAAWKDYPDLEWWRSYFSDIQYSDWHAGRKEWTGADFEWAVKNRAKLREFLSVRKPKPKDYRPPWLPPKQPDPPEEELLTPDPDCPLCHGEGVTKEGPCKCLHPVVERKDSAAKHCQSHA
ncbi:MAG: hypothetical protein JRI50_09995 [Deltaproteobacteria bacterium]|nr:hypothetical protein [Deltaproteobacteria bacterium]